MLPDLREPKTCPRLFLVATTAVTTNPKGYGHIMTEQNEVEVYSPNTLRADIAALNTGGGVFHTFQGADFATKVKVLDAMTNSTPVADNIGTIINLANVVVQPVDMENERTKAIEAQPRIILIDADGKAYHAISGGLFRSLQNIFGVLGKPDTWNAPLPIVIDKVKGGKGNFFTARIAV